MPGLITNVIVKFRYIIISKDLIPKNGVECASQDKSLEIDQFINIKD